MRKKKFPIVYVGGSAGGFETFIEFLKLIPPGLGISIVIVNHITHQPTTLHNSLSKYTLMPVELITQNLRILPNYIYVIPHNCDLHVLNGHFRLRPKSKRSGWPNVITLFLSSLALCWEGLLIVVIV